MALPLLFLQRPLGEGIDPVDEGTSGRHRGGGERRLDKRKATTGSEEASPLIRKKSDFRRQVSQTVTFSLSSCSTFDFWTQDTQLFFLLGESSLTFFSEATLHPKLPAAENANVVEKTSKTWSTETFFRLRRRSNQSHSVAVIFIKVVAIKTEKKKKIKR